MTERIDLTRGGASKTARSKAEPAEPRCEAKLPLTDIAERLIYSEEALNRVCEKMMEAVQRILRRDLQIEDDAWQKAEAELTDEQLLAVWLEAIESLG